MRGSLTILVKLYIAQLGNNEIQGLNWLEIEVESVATE